MSRMTVSINRINKMLDSISGMDGLATDLVEKGIEPMVKSITDFLHKISEDLCLEPLTFEELKQLAVNEIPVWVKPLDERCGKELGGYGVIFKDEVWMPGIEYTRWDFRDYKKTWVAYSKNPNDI